MGKDLRRVRSHDGCPPYDAAHPKRILRLAISRDSVRASSSQAHSAPSSPLPVTAPPPSPAPSEADLTLIINNPFELLSIDEPMEPPMEPNTQQNAPPAPEPIEPAPAPPASPVRPRATSHPCLPSKDLRRATHLRGILY
ncbi:hypothetical protein SISNIDRAFT_490927 [Sistotremastrum niveocremeum HHB9708]|uniref:Uncharacterized protein n=1 Tax=Sistotremastrum niveocremeum HHB9708 TaxID=1314777 RepID=A0A164NCE5_9AGAM|nr:hypothetical protein SISNIDRAFT_490927 [Sistotremastrum niveocremeum HHB9708]